MSLHGPPVITSPALVLVCQAHPVFPRVLGIWTSWLYSKDSTHWVISPAPFLSSDKFDDNGGYKGALDGIVVRWGKNWNP